MLWVHGRSEAKLVLSNFLETVKKEFKPIKEVFVSKDIYHLFYSSFSHTFSNFTLLVSCFKTLHPCITKKALEDFS